MASLSLSLSPTPYGLKLSLSFSLSSASDRCFDGGLCWTTIGKALELALSQFGEIAGSKIINDRETGRSRGSEFVTSKDEQSMREAIGRMNGQDLDGRNITVNEAQSRGSGGGGFRQGGYGGIAAAAAAFMAMAVAVTVGMVMLGGPVTAGMVGIRMAIGRTRINVLNCSGVNMGSGFGNSVVF